MLKPSRLRARSNKSGSSDQVISLPKGGGVMHGMGEKFSPDLHTGTGSFTVQIAMPSDHNGFHLQLNPYAPAIVLSITPTRSDFSKEACHDPVIWKSKLSPKICSAN